MQTTSPATSASEFQAPQVGSEEPVAMIPVASVAPLDGPPDGERLTTFALAPNNIQPAPEEFGVRLREAVLAKPLTATAAAFLMGFILARTLR